jgi:ABC-type multidrug transport system fused ATPase/permease subunit
VIEEGRVTEQGAPKALMRRDGWFSRFMRSAEDAAPGWAESSEPH